MRNYKKYEVWNNAIEFAVKTYELTKLFPDEEKFGLVSQMRRAAVSIPSNIAEGCSRTSEKEFNRFLEYSIGSAFEVDTQMIIANKLGFIKNDQFKENSDALEIISKQLNSLSSKLSKKKS